MLSLAHIVIPKLNLKHEIAKTKLYELPKEIISRNGWLLVIRTSLTIKVLIAPLSFGLNKQVPSNCTAEGGEREFRIMITLTHPSSVPGSIKRQVLLLLCLLNSPFGRTPAIRQKISCHCPKLVLRFGQLICAEILKFYTTINLKTSGKLQVST